MGTGQNASRLTVKAVFFDLDGTLVDHVLAEKRAAQIFYEKHRSSLRPPTYETFVREWETASEKHMEQFLCGNIGFQEQRQRRIRDVVLQPVSPEEADHIFADYLEAYEANWTIFPEVRDVLATLRHRGVRMGVITNGDAAQQKRKLETTDLSRFFEHAFISGKLGFSKPDSMIFQNAAEGMGCKVEECIHIGDSFGNDVNGALAAGMRAVWLDREGQEPPVGEGHCTHVHDLREILGARWLP
jgi:putative hydrolase of the HAD superfamily